MTATKENLANLEDPEIEELADPESDDKMTLLSNYITELSSGDRAALRRIFLTKRHDADGVVIGLIHRVGWDVPIHAETFAPWRLLVHVAALLSGTAGGPSHSARPFGSALQAAGYSETALLRLTAARGPILQDHIIRAARRLAQKGKGPINLWTVLDLSGRNATKVEEARLSVARNFYRAAPPKEKDSK